MEKNNSSEFPFVDRKPEGKKVLAKDMTLRDYFAGQAMKGFLSDSSIRVRIITGNLDLYKASYVHADQMLKERQE